MKKTNNPGEFVGSFDEDDKGKKAILFAKAPGFALAIKEIYLPPRNTPVEITLGPACTITGRVVDEQQNPIAKAYVRASKWGKYDFRERASGWFSYTDPNGYFSWTEAPEDELDFVVGHERYMWNYIKMAPSENDYVITLKPAIRIHGTVTDAETGKPIERFRLFPAEYIGGDINFQRLDAKLYTNGQFDFNHNNSYNGQIIAIEAEGYKAVVSVPLIVDKGDFVYNFQLHKTTGIDDLVRFPDYLKTEDAKKFLAGTYFIEDSQKASMLEKLKQNNKQIEKKFKHVNNIYEGDFVLDKDIPIELCAGTSDNPYIITAESVRFKKLDNKHLIASPKLRILSWPKFEYSMKSELLDADGKVLYVGRSAGGNAGIIFGIPFETHRTGHISLGWQIDISTVKRFKITIYPQSVSDKDARVVKKFFAHIDREIGKLVSQYPQLADWDTVKTDSSWHSAGKKVTDERFTYSHALLSGKPSNYADLYGRNGCRIQISVFIKETWNRRAEYENNPNVFVLKMGNFFVVAIVRTKKPEVPELEQKINDILNFNLK
ncbi:MAG: carboxypeptidase regulatory-like domain-containing protein, partial [Sedimentisphaerales bacterium]|nr:carboxypeptidase regulatory-like domain-containing protein [Sedimentisphaerales bacterium]